MANENALEGIRCPKCGQEDRFNVVAKIWVTVTDDGSVPSEELGRGDHEWDDDAPTECLKCGYRDRWAAFDSLEPVSSPLSRFDAEINVLARRVSALELAVDNLLHRSTVEQAGTPEQVRDMLYDGLTDARRGIDSDTGRKRQ